VPTMKIFCNTDSSKLYNCRLVGGWMKILPI
jgi:hypothetical protein